MDERIRELTSPAVPSGLSFDKNDFVKSTFSVDAFLEEHKGVPLETLRDDLGAYLKVLRLAMIDLINKDYNNFVKLSATLIGFDSSLKDLREPLLKINHDVKAVKEYLDEVINQLQLWLMQKRCVAEKKSTLMHLNQSLKNIAMLQSIETQISAEKSEDDLILAERAVAIYNQLLFSLTKCNELVKTQDQATCAAVGSRLNDKLLNMVHYYFNKKMLNEIVLILVLQASLGKITETEEFIKSKVIDLYLQDILTDSNLQKKSLAEVLNNVLVLLENHLKLLVDITKDPKLNNLPKKYDLLINGFWCAVERKIEVQIPSIFAPGNPNYFFSKYNDSMVFLEKFQDILNDDYLVKKMVATNEYKSFMKRWNLPVYFQIRFQEIAGACESVFNENSKSKENENKFHYQATCVCWESLNKTWSNGVFIEAIGHKFFKLTLQILSRYSLWASSQCGNIKAITTSEEISINKTTVQETVQLYIDVIKLTQKMPLLMQCIESKVNNKKAIIIMQKQLEESIKKLENNILLFRKCISAEYVRCCNSLLRKVSDIPRLYRKTNKSVPKTPCSYIDRVNEEIASFRNDYKTVLGHDFVMNVELDIFNQITFQYYKSVEDVLTSFEKTEESLRRLKQISQGNNRQTNEQSSNTITDGDKIRMQVYIDVNSYCDCIEKYGLKLEQIDGAHQIVELVKSIGVKL